MDVQRSIQNCLRTACCGADSQGEKVPIMYFYAFWHFGYRATRLPTDRRSNFEAAGFGWINEEIPEYSPAQNWRVCTRTIKCQLLFQKREWFWRVARGNYLRTRVKTYIRLSIDDLSFKWSHTHFKRYATIPIWRVAWRCIGHRSRLDETPKF